MSELYFPDQNQKITDAEQITRILASRGLTFSRWEAKALLTNDDSPETILAAYQHEVKPFMEKHGFLAADVINVHPETPNLEAIRHKFLQEHVHTEDEVRFFVDGQGEFWLHFADGVVASLMCYRNDFIAIPANTKHWFDLAPAYHCKAIRIFTNPEGWVAQYTGSEIEKRYFK
ncbi:MAG: hypothetical protein A2508_08615 [Candidatus Lambdaproteobacteria bacterium RIFOXYD12_FULL_49_8]|uniref:Acireductone dioxygenase n=1 Tax=Candidatus Lambdaproteobacteria bacterium RIFOXYD2_FULL_50_16 TaxID=1817772 RepID=A0A1F6GAE3_9PROT|nr:MAG: hypothetical protein A2527_07810 [Candidatus Lambdaproteobacteria bacterium RIFOXYD2_FULL_50_16]OGG98002.1 MAG: hypothetical protein A2508_08615 [Candidatus Lambdaproteobacteria bacterium RIFOXYD12_FULL_49_8]